MRKHITHIGLTVIFTFTVFLSLFPVYYAWIETPRGYVFSGQASWFDPWDINVYVNAIRSGQRGSVLLRNAYTTEPNNPVLMYPTYTVAGYLMRNVKPFAVFYSLSVMTTLLLVLGLYAISTTFILKHAERLAVVALTLLGGGFGFLVYPYRTPDLTMTSFTFASAIQRPHEAIGVFFYLVSVVLIYRVISVSRFSFGEILIGAVSSGIAAIYYPYLSLSIVLMLIAGFIIKRKNISFLKGMSLFLAYGLLMAGSVGLMLRSFSLNPTFRSVYTQNLPTPAIQNVIFGYGLFSVLCIYLALSKNKSDKERFMLVWVTSGILLSYVPFGIARFFLRGLFFPIVVLSIIAVRHIADRLRINGVVLYGILVLLTIGTSVYTFGKRINEVRNGNPWFYLTESEYAQVLYLEKTGSGFGVLSLYHIGNTLPAFTDTVVYAGHLIQSPDATDKFRLAGKFYTLKMSEPEARQFLRSGLIRYVYWGSEESDVTGNSTQIQDPQSRYPFLIPRSVQEGVTVYEVR